MKLYTINTGFFKLDGGAMFGVVPKSIWNKLVPSDEFNLCTWAMRCLLIENDKRLILVDTGIGNKQDSKFFSHYYLHGEDTLEKSIQKAGFSLEDITDVVLTHLHFDHCGGAVSYSDDRSKLQLTFKNAVYWSNSDHWKWAVEPNPREKASFLKENILPIQESGHLKFVMDPLRDLGIEIIVVNGHTEKQMLPVIYYKGRKLIFAADLIPSIAHIPIPYVMGYDVRPLLTLEEKQLILTNAAEENSILFFEHDAVHECCTLQFSEKGVRVKESFKLSEI